MPLRFTETFLNPNNDLFPDGQEEFPYALHRQRWNAGYDL